MPPKSKPEPKSVSRSKPGPTPGPVGRAPALDTLPTRDPDSGDYLAVVEACRGSPNKLKFDPKRGVFELHHVLPLGQAFPYDFGFLPSTQGEDGDPLDVLLLMDEPVPAGVVVPCRLLGVIRAMQADRGDDGDVDRGGKGGKARKKRVEKPVRNDRFLAVASRSQRYRELRDLDDLAPRVLDEIEGFFVAYNDRKGVDFRPDGRLPAKEARALVDAGARRFGRGRE